MSVGRAATQYYGVAATHRYAAAEVSNAADDFVARTRITASPMFCIGRIAISLLYCVLATATL